MQQPDSRREHLKFSLAVRLPIRLKAAVRTGPEARAPYLPVVGPLPPLARRIW